MATVAAALRRVRAVRPTWYEGQPEHVIAAGMLIERTRCVKCHKPLPEGNFKYCSRLCGQAHAKRAETLRNANEDRAIWAAIHWT